MEMKLTCLHVNLLRVSGILDGFKRGNSGNVLSRPTDTIASSPLATCKLHGHAGAQAHSFTSILTVAILTLLAVCVAMPEAPPHSLEERYVNIVIVPARLAPETEFITFARSPVTGAVKVAVVDSYEDVPWVPIHE